MKLTLLHDVIINDGRRGIPCKKGQTVEVENKSDARLLVINHQAVAAGSETKKAA